MIEQFLDNETTVAVKNNEIFGDEKIRYGKVSGWNLSMLHEANETKTDLTYRIVLLKSKQEIWISAACITGFLKGV